MKKQQQTSKTPDQGKHSLMITFHDGSEYARVLEAARIDQLHIRAELGKRYPNISMFLRQAAKEKTDRLLGDTKRRSA